MTAPGDPREFKKILGGKEAELVLVLRTRDEIAIERSADQLDELQYASERDLAIRNVDRASTVLREVKAALQRIRDGSFGTCIQCEGAINPKRLAAVPWAPLCIECQEAADRDNFEEAESLIDTLVKVAGTWTSDVQQNRHRVQVPHPAAAGLPAGSKRRDFPYGPIRALKDTCKGA